MRSTLTLLNVIREQAETLAELALDGAVQPLDAATQASTYLTAGSGCGRLRAVTHVAPVGRCQLRMRDHVDNGEPGDASGA